MTAVVFICDEIIDIRYESGTWNKNEIRGLLGP